MDIPVATDLLGTEVRFAWDRNATADDGQGSGRYTRRGRVRAVYLKEYEGRPVLHLLVADDDGSLDERHAENCHIVKE